MGTDQDTGRDTPSVSDRVADRIRAAVLDGEFGARERLTEAALARRCGVSRTPVRRALARLEADGLVRRSGGSYQVVVPGPDELSDLCELRMTLELRGIARVIEDPTLAHDRGILQRQHAWWSELTRTPPEPDRRFVLHDERFHVALLAASGNPALTAALVSVNERIRRIRMYDVPAPDRIAATVGEHLRIVRLLLTGELRSAYRALHDHLGASPEVVRERAQRAYSRMALNGGLS